jgi:hypothetical protein
MNTRRNKRASNRRNKSRKAPVGKKWMSAFSAASQTLTKTKSLPAARESLRRQALSNARKLFGSIGI